MPPWMISLLLKHDSKGMVDSLQTLVGAHPQYNQSPDQKIRVGNQFADQLGELTARNGQPVINLTPLAIDNYANTKVRTGYDPSRQLPSQLGDAVIQHEFGHLAAYNNLAGDFLKIDPDAPTSEAMADHFQNAFQFLRSHKTDTSGLDSTTQKVIDVILAQPLYENHPINQARARDAQLKLLAGKPPS